MHPQPRTPAEKAKFHKVMHENKEGTLKSSSGKPVTGLGQALAIAFSEASRVGKKKGK